VAADVAGAARDHCVLAVGGDVLAVTVMVVVVATVTVMATAPAPAVDGGDIVVNVDATVVTVVVHVAAVDGGDVVANMVVDVAGADRDECVLAVGGDVLAVMAMVVVVATVMVSGFLGFQVSRFLGF